MALTTLEKGKGKELLETEKDREELNEESPQASSDLETDSDLDLSSSDDSDSEDEVTPEMLDALLERARQNAQASSSKSSTSGIVTFREEDLIQLGQGEDEEA